MNLIDRDEAIKRLGDAHFKNYGNAIMVIRETPTVDAVPVSFIQQYIDRFYENEKHYYRSKDMVGYAFKAKRVLLQRLIEAWENEKRKQNET